MSTEQLLLREVADLLSFELKQCQRHDLCTVRITRGRANDIVARIRKAQASSKRITKRKPSWISEL